MPFICGSKEYIFAELKYFWNIKANCPLFEPTSMQLSILGNVLNKTESSVNGKTKFKYALKNVKLEMININFQNFTL